jgi:hypothetical protein
MVTAAWGDVELEPASLGWEDNDFDSVRPYLPEAVIIGIQMRGALETFISKHLKEFFEHAQTVASQMRVCIVEDGISIFNGREAEVRKLWSDLLAAGAKYVCAPLQDPDDGTWFANLDFNPKIRNRVVAIGGQYEREAIE